MRRTSGPNFVPPDPDPDETVGINPIRLENGEEASASDKKVGTALAAIFVGMIIVLCGSGVAWAVVNMWKDILS